VVFSGATAGGDTVSSGGVAVVGGTAVGTVVSGGTQEVGGAVLQNSTTYTFIGGIASNTSVGSGGVQSVPSGSTAIATTVLAGGVEIISSGGTEAGTTISGGTLQLQSGAIVSGGVGKRAVCSSSAARPFRPAW
jgi:autotransporter passenger strand-loop-strand repeat protein